MTIEQTFQRAQQQHEAGRLAEAEALYRQILRAEPRHADAFHMLGVIAIQMGRNDLAVGLIGRAIALKPNSPEACYDLGNALKWRGQVDDAITAYCRALALKFDYPEAHLNLGVALQGKGQLDTAIAAYRQAFALRPDFPEAYYNLGNVLRDKGQLDEAIAAYDRAIALKPDYPEALNNVGNVRKANGQVDEAIAAFRRAIALRPDYSEAYCNLGCALHDKGQLDEAIAAYRQAIALKPDFPEAHSNLGAAKYDAGQLDEAIAACHQAIAAQPDHAEGHCNLAIALYHAGQLEEAIATYRHALALKPDLAEAHFNFAIVLLAHGDFFPGWEEYEWRWRVKEGGPFPRNFTQPQWDGSLLEGRTILLHAEQGFGDTLQFVRYVPLVAQRGGRVILECQPELATLLADVAGISQIVAHGEPLPAFDVHCPLMGLPRAFGTQVETIPADIPYLRADAQKAARWGERLEQETTSPEGGDSGRSRPLKVGLVWAGGTRLHELHSNRIDRRRSMALNQFAPLAGVPGVVFVSLQKGGPAEQALTPPAGLHLLDWTAALQDFADTAALVESLDLVISVDTAVAHLAGALGKPVWVLHRFDNCWRWLRDRTDSPWYPTMRLFQQSKPGEWEPVMERVAGALREASISMSTGR